MTRWIDTPEHEAALILATHLRRKLAASGSRNGKADRAAEDLLTAMRVEVHDAVDIDEESRSIWNRSLSELDYARRGLLGSDSAAAQ